jgi:hypothetical protein
MTEKRRPEIRRAVGNDAQGAVAPRERLVANGSGGHASATITGTITRRYHGLLIAALPAPLGRMVCSMISKSMSNTRTAAL